jgi:DNA-binding FadR family transcriptional regulator
MKKFMDFEKSEFDELVENDIDLKNVFDHLKSNFEVGAEISSERVLVDIIGYSRVKTRELLIVLDCYGLVDIQHGKSTILRQKIANLSSNELEARFIEKLKADPDLKKFISTLSRSIGIGDKLPGERKLKKAFQTNRGKVRELLIRLEGCGYLQKSSHGKNRILIKLLPSD